MSNNLRNDDLYIYIFKIIALTSKGVMFDDAIKRASGKCDDRPEATKSIYSMLILSGISVGCSWYMIKKMYHIYRAYLISKIIRSLK